jgi:hypothetical protein
MPLRAEVDGQRVVAPLVPPDEWRVLAADLRAGRRTATLPCCGGPAFGRTSRQGLAHFVHQRREGCAAGRESLAHLRLKAAVLRACQAAGWGVEPEAAGPDWRADVLATPRLPTALDDLLGGRRHRPPWRVAVEVQLSRIDGPALLDRQARYARDRVRGCWLVGPAATGQRPGAAWDEAAVAARLGLPPGTPAFALLEGEAPVVGCAGRAVPLAAFVAALLGRRVRFLARLTPAALPFRALLYEAWCPACGGRCHPHLVAGWFAAACGARGSVRRAAEGVGSSAPPEFAPAVLAAVAANSGAGLRPCPVGPAGADGRPAFHCPACGRALPAAHLAHAAWPVRRGAAAPAAEVALAAVPGLICEVAQPHWCVALDGDACDEAAPG